MESLLTPSTSLDSNRLSCVETVLKSITGSQVEGCFQYILNGLTEDEQRRFGTTLLRKIIEPNNSTFYLDATVVQETLGFSSKRSFVHTMKRILVESEHYIKVLPEDLGQVGRPTDLYLLNLEGVRLLSMEVDTDEGKIARRYYLHLEELLIGYGMKQLQELNSKFAQVEQRCEALNEECQRLRGGQKVDAEPGQTVYIFVSKDGVKVGRTGNMQQRGLNYKTCNPDGSFKDWVYCVDSVATEKAAHHLLNEYEKKRGSEWFNCSWEVAKETTKCAQLFLDGLTGHASALLDYGMSQKLREFLYDFYVFYDSGGYAERAHTETTKEILSVAPPQEVLFRDWTLSNFKGTLSGKVPVRETPPENVMHVPKVQPAVNDQPIIKQEDKILADTPIDPRVVALCSDLLAVDDGSSTMQATVLNAARFCNPSFDGVPNDLLLFVASLYGPPRPEYDKYLGGEKLLFDNVSCLKPDIPVVDAFYREFVNRYFVAGVDGWSSKSQFISALKEWKTDISEKEIANFLNSMGLAYPKVDLPHPYHREVMREGFQGFTLKAIVGEGLTECRSGSRKLFVRDSRSGDITRVFDNQSHAAKSLNLSPSNITTAKNTGKPIRGGWILQDITDISEHEKAAILSLHDNLVLETGPFGSAATVHMQNSSTPSETGMLDYVDVIGSGHSRSEDYQHFLDECCVEDKLGSVMNVQLTGVYHVWAGNAWAKRKRDKMLEYVGSKYKAGKAGYDKFLGGRKRIFLGLQLKPIAFVKQNGGIFDRFVSECLIVDCNARATVARLHDTFKGWNEANNNPSQSLEELQSFLKRLFIYDIIWTGSEQTAGYIGCGIAGELSLVGTHPCREEKGGVKLINPSDGSIFKEFSDFRLAADYLGCTPSNIKLLKKKGGLVRGKYKLELVEEELDA